MKRNATVSETTQRTQLTLRFNVFTVTLCTIWRGCRSYDCKSSGYIPDGTRDFVFVTEYPTDQLWSSPYAVRRYTWLYP